MLYDKRWDKQIDVEPRDPWVLADFITWLKSQPLDTRYHYTRAHTCLIAQYLQAQGIEHYALGGHEIPEPFHRIAVYFPWTFRSALRRAQWRFWLRRISFR